MIQHFPSLALFLQIRSSRFLLAVLHRLSFVHLYAVACILEKWFFQVELFQRKWQDTHPFALHYLPVSSLPSLLKLSSFDWSFWPQIFGSIRRTSAKVSARIWAPGSRDGDLVRTFGDTSRSEDADAAAPPLVCWRVRPSKWVSSLLWIDAICEYQRILLLKSGSISTQTSFLHSRLSCYRFGFLEFRLLILRNLWLLSDR